jgi:DNA polymerase I-like protein with 3'-5' exonuclease and polymerase domains
MQLTQGIYGGSSYSYANDPDFRSVSTRQDFWQDVIDKYYAKYSGIAQWHKDLLYEAQHTGRITIPSGRYFPITPDITKEQSWPLTIIKNYPVQGFGADLVSIARLRANQLIYASGIEQAKLVGTIHDSIVVDCTEEVCYTIGKLLKQAVEEVPEYCQKLWDYSFSLPLKCELACGPNKLNMKELNAN